MTNGPIGESQVGTFVYDARDRLTSAGGVAYAYDSEDNRKTSTYSANGVTVNLSYIYDRSGEVSDVLIRNKTTAAGTQSTYYVYGAGLDYEVSFNADGSESAVSYYHYDQIGSTIALTDASGDIIDRFSYDAWGYVSHTAGTSETPFLYAGIFGVQTDPNGLINMRARYYNPTTMAFLTSDPSGFEGGLNWYLYASGDPLSRVDANGMWDGSAIGGNYLSSTFAGISSPANPRGLMTEIYAHQILEGQRDMVNPLYLIPFARTFSNYLDNKPYAADLAMDVVSILPIGKIAGMAKSIAAVGEGVRAARIGLVGTYKELRAIAKYSGLEAHHVGQAAVMKALIPNYNYMEAPAILIPSLGHTRKLPGCGILSRNSGIESARSLLARDIMELRRVYGKTIGNSDLRRLIQMNKDLYSEMR